MIQHLPIDLFWFLAIVTVSMIIGIRAIRACFKESLNDSIMELCLAFGIGLGILSFLTFLIAISGLLYPSVLMGMLIFILLLLHGEIKRFIFLIKEFVKEFRLASIGRFQTFLICLFFTAVVCNFLFNYTPPTQGRELLYNLTLPKLLLENHGFVAKFEERTLHYPFLLELIYALAMGVGSVQAAKLIHFSLGIFSAIAVYRLSGAFVGGNISLLSATIVYLMPLVSSVSGTANVELGTLFYGLLTFYALLKWVERSENRWFYIAAWMVGYSCLAKITGLSLIPTCFLFALGWMIMGRKIKFVEIIKILAIFSVISFLVFSPWWLKNLYFSGNPLYPFPVNALGWMGHENAALEIQTLTRLKDQYTFWQVLKMHNNILIGDIFFGPGPLVFAFLLPALLVNRQRIISLFLFFIALSFLFHNLLFNTYFHRFLDTRFYILIYALLAILSAKGMENAKQFLPGKLVNGIIISGFLFPCLLIPMMFGLTKLKLFTGMESEQEYLRRKLENYSLFSFGNTNLPKDSKVLVLGSGDPHWYYWDVPVVPPSQSLLNFRDVKCVLAELRRSGITHILFFKDFFRLDSTGGFYEDVSRSGLNLHWDLDVWVGKYFKEIYSEKGTTLYRIEYPVKNLEDTTDCM